MENRNAQNTINVLKKSILLRKYGYLFYRKTISKILPSQARKRYIKQLQRRTLSFWIASSYHERAAWKLAVRSNLHYAYASKRKAFKKWKLFFMRCTIKKLQNDLAMKHYDKKIKIKYFVTLLHARKLLVCKNKLADILLERLVICSCFIDWIILSWKFTDSLKNYIARKHATEKWKSNNLKLYFQKLVNHANCEIAKSNNELKAHIFFKKKNHVDILRPFFKNWLKYTTNCITKRVKYENASNMFRQKILHGALNKLVTYKRYKFVNRSKLVSALQAYEVHLKQNSLKKWSRLVERNRVKAAQIEKVEDHYRKKIMRLNLSKLVRYKNYKQMKRGMVQIVENHFKVKVTLKYFNFLRKYHDHKQTKKLQTALATTHYNNKIIEKHFALVLKYHKKRAQKMRKNAQLIENTFVRCKTTVKKLHFSKWKLFTSICKEDLLKQSLAEAKYRKLLIKAGFVVWKRFVEQKHLAMKVKQLQRKKMSFAKWYDFTVQAREYTKKLNLAQNIYKDTLVKKGLSVMFKACYEKQRLVESMLLKRIERDFYLALKYYKTWKYKVFQSAMYVTGDHTNVCKSFTETQLASITDLRLNRYVESVDFKWNDACLEKPRIPHFLRESLKDIFA